MLHSHIAPNGYLRISSRTLFVIGSAYVHRLVCEAWHGCSDLPFVRHRNGRKLDCRPDNLAWGTRQDNADDMVRLGESARGERHGRAKLSAEHVLAIRGDCRRQADIAAEYGVSKSLIGQIKRKEVWQ